MPSSSFTISGSNWNIKDELGQYVTTDQQFALLQFPVGFEPWRATSIYQIQPNMVDWSVNYTASTKTFSSTAPFVTSFDAPIYLWTQLNTNYQQAGMWQITSYLTIVDGANYTVDLDANAMKDVIGSHTGNTLHTQDYTLWTGTAVPEPSYAPMVGVLLLIVVVAKKLKWA